MTLKLKDAVLRHNNNFDLVRLIASLLVIYGHAFYLFNAGMQQDILRKHIGIDSGGIAVCVFFFLSGMFISASYVKAESVKKYILMRVFRIWPALIICIVLTVFIVGPIFTTTDLKSYFSAGQTWVFFFKNITLIKFEPKLTGVFEHNHFNDSVNGSLWTLPNEIKCYVLVLIIGLSGLLKRKFVSPLTFAAFVILLCLHNSVLIEQLTFFAAGMASYALKDYIVLDFKIAIVLLVLTILSHFLAPGIFHIAFFIFLLYFVLVFATTDIARKIKLPGDFSYGLYIYGFLIQQIVANMFPKISSITSILYTLPVVILISMLSWYCIELPSIKFGKRLTGTSA